MLASTTAIVTVAGPWLSRRWKRALWWGVGALVVLRLMAVGVPAFDIVVTLGVGTIVGSLVLLVFGSPSTEPTGVDLLAGVRAVGLRPVRIERPPSDDAALRYRLVEDDSTTYDIGLRTPDERDADLLTRTYRNLRFRPSEVEPAYSTLKRRLEHEALVLTLAERGASGSPTWCAWGRRVAARRSW